ncbi:4'-phosphopantetheinyl transferase superfamily protein [Prochlorococcus sp. AH-716-B20]|nr:4'-phosphopantetheinyl transferase superfamily protein [Prochlorococcus sp. AH-716-B20]
MLLNLPIKNEIKIWLYSKNLPLQPITEKELKWKELISCKNFHNYHHSRGYIRYSLSKLFKMPALDIPLYSNPREAPKLENKFGYLSLSHTLDSIIIGWAPRPLGIDYENKKRIFSAKKIHDRYFFKSEQELLALKKINFRQNVLKFWIIKEAAFKWQIKKDYTDLLNWEWEMSRNNAFNKEKNLVVKAQIIDYDPYFIGVAYN